MDRSNSGLASRRQLSYKCTGVVHTRHFGSSREDSRLWVVILRKDELGSWKRSKGNSIIVKNI